MHLVRQGLHAVDRQEGLAVERVDGQPIRILLAGELAGVLVQSMMAGMVASSGYSERQAAEGEQLELGLGA